MKLVDRVRKCSDKRTLAQITKVLDRADAREKQRAARREARIERRCAQLAAKIKQLQAQQ